MIDIETTVESPPYSSYRAARVRSLFNVSEDQGSKHTVKVSLPIDEKEWQIGVVVGASGSGKTTLGKQLFGAGRLHQGFEWSREAPIIDEVGADADFNEVTGALSSVGLGTVPSWLRPFHVLSMGEQFRAELARIIIEKPKEIVIDEFTSVVDRQIATIGAMAFAKAWRRTGGKVILLSCHYDILDWVQPDWVLDTTHWEFSWGFLRQRPEIKVDIYQTGSSAAWPFFKKHHYLDLPNPVAPTYYVGEVNGTPVAYLAVCTMSGMKQCRLTRLVVMPEWQGAGVGMRFLEAIAQDWLEGKNRYNKKMPGIIHTSHPGLIFALNRSKKWTLVSQQMGGQDKVRSAKSIRKSAHKFADGGKKTGKTGYGGHLRSVAGFRYVGVV